MVKITVQFDDGTEQTFTGRAAVVLLSPKDGEGDVTVCAADCGEEEFLELVSSVMAVELEDYSREGVVYS